MERPPLTYAMCTWNRAERLPGLLAELRQLECPVPFEVLVVDNNSTDGTREIVQAATREDGGATVRYVFEPEQGIVHARNRAIREAIHSEYLVFIDDDEHPHRDVLKAAYHALHDEGADCVGGRIRVRFENGVRPPWLTDELLGFLGNADHGNEPFWITGRETPVWSGNVAYRMKMFREDEELRFDSRYNRVGKQVGGGSDAVMFWTLLERGMRIRYRPDMVVEHEVESWRLQRSYFLRLHYRAGVRQGCYRLSLTDRKIMGVPPYLLNIAVRQWMQTFMLGLAGRPVLRQAMNAMHALGMIRGAWLAAREGKSRRD